MIYTFFDTKASSPDRKTVGSGINENIKLANELHKPIIRKFNKRKVYSSFKDNYRANLIKESSIFYVLLTYFISMPLLFH